MTQGNNEIEAQLNRLLAEMDANRRRLQAEISARQKAEKDLRDFAASRNVKILQATEEALRSAWEELEEQRLVIKEQQGRIRFLETRLAEWENAGPANQELAPAGAEDEPLAMGEEMPGFEGSPPDPGALPVLLDSVNRPIIEDLVPPVDEPAEELLELVPDVLQLAETPVPAGETPPEEEPAAAATETAAAVKAVTAADSAIMVGSGAGSRPWYLDRQVFAWLASAPADGPAVSSAARRSLAADDAMPGYAWHQSGPEMESSVRVSFRGRRLSLPMLKRFIDEEPGICVLILRDVNEERLEEAEKGARRLRLAAREIGAAELEERAGEVESLLMQGEERIFVVRRVVEMESAMKALLEEIMTLLEAGSAENISAGAGGPEDRPAVLLRRLGRLLADGSDEVRAYLDEHGSALADLLDSEEWEDFLRNVQDARYEQALQMIEYYL